MRSLGIEVRANTVARLLKLLGYSLRVNRKKIESGSKNPPTKEVRNQQFEYIGERRERYAAQGHAIISIDTKKREMVGNFKNAGATYQEDAQDVFDHDFLSDASGVAIPYGIYDTRANRGAVFVGTSYDTPEFAVDCIASWWEEIGRHHYEPKILILADGGGSNGWRPRMWKWQLHKVLCEGCGLKISVSHYPAGCSKYNPIEHRLFSEISKNWAGQPLRNYQTVLNYIRTTATKTGLQVEAEIVTKAYEKGRKISDDEFKIFKETHIKSHTTLPNWNYSFAPSQLKM